MRDIFLFSLRKRANECLISEKGYLPILANNNNNNNKNKNLLKGTLHNKWVAEKIYK